MSLNCVREALVSGEADLKPAKRPTVAQLEEEIVEAVRVNVACMRPSMRSAANIYGHLYREVLTYLIVDGIERPDLTNAVAEIIGANLEEAFRSTMEQVHITAECTHPIEVVTLDESELENRIVN